MSYFSPGDRVSYASRRFGNLITFYGIVEEVIGERVSVKLSHVEEWKDGQLLGSDEFIMNPVEVVDDCILLKEGGDFDA